MYMTRKSLEKEQRQPVAPPVDAEELYRRHLRIRAERDMIRNEIDYTGTEVKKANSGDILS